MVASPVPQKQQSSRPRLVLAMLMLVYTFNFIDRQILGVLVQPIKADLHLSDAQLGALGGTAFALLYSILGVPLAMLADRTGRARVITISLAVWSGFTALCGQAGGFWMLFLCRLGVGVGEAGGVAPSYAIITDIFPPTQRARALSIYALGVPIGTAAGAILGGYIAYLVNWRAAFMTIGLLGVLIAPIFLFVVGSSTSAQGRKTGAALAEGVRVSDVLPLLARKRSFWLMSLAAAISSFSGYGVAFWAPSFFMRRFGFDLLQASQFYGSLMLVGGSLGVLAGGRLADNMGQRDCANYLKLPAMAWLTTLPLLILGFLAHTPWAVWLLLVIPCGLNILWIGPVTTAIQHLVRPGLRASASAMFLLVNNLVGLGVGSWIIGFLSDATIRWFGAQSLRYALMLSSGFYLIAALLALAAARSLRKDWIAE